MDTPAKAKVKNASTVARMPNMMSVLSESLSGHAVVYGENGDVVVVLDGKLELRYMVVNDKCKSRLGMRLECFDICFRPRKLCCGANSTECNCMEEQMCSLIIVALRV